MNISRYVQDLQNQLSVAADAAGDDAKIVAERLASTLESTARLVLLEALSDAAGEITTELAPGSVDLRLRGREPEFVVTAPPTSRFEGEASATDSMPQDESLTEPDGTEGAMSRTTLRLPESVKLRVETAAAREGLSVNSWFLRVVTAALAGGATASPSSARLRSTGSRFTGWVR
ncbi:MAG: histidine kinase [Microbacteriaceae bacterium]|nr:MAG: histidine kinase [Microbacteriaceae bacterium]